MQGPDGIIYSIDLDGISRVAALERAVLGLQEAIEEIATQLPENTLSDNVAATLAASSEEIASSLEESEAAVDEQKASVLSQTEALTLRLSAVQEEQDSALEESASDTGTITVTPDDTE